MTMESLTVFFGSLLDCFFDRIHLEVAVNSSIGYKPWRFDYAAEDFVLRPLDYIAIRFFRGTPDLDAV